MERNDWSSTTQKFAPAMRMEMMMDRITTLLVVDDDPQVCLLMERCLKEHFNEVFTATNPLDGHAILEARRVTHVLADLRLGGQTDGAAFATFWKREFSCVERTVIFTAGDVREVGAYDRATPPKEIDAVVSKVDGLDAIVAALLGDAP